MKLVQICLVFLIFVIGTAYGQSQPIFSDVPVKDPAYQSLSLLKHYK